MTNYLYMDIETIPAQSNSARDYLARSAKVDSRLKDPAKIEAARADAEADALAKTSFDGWFGHVIAIAVARDDGEIITSCARTLDEEANLIRGLFAGLDVYHRPTIVGHNVAGFDVPFLTRRAVSLGIPLPPSVCWPRDPKPWDRQINDTMTMAAGVKDRIGLDRLCNALGIAGKDGFDGSQVAEAWARGEYDRIAAYCGDDVSRVRSVHQRFTQVGWAA